MHRSRLRAVAALVLVGASLAAASAQTEPTPVKGESAGKPPSAATSLIRFDRPVVFTLALGNDVATNARIAVALATRLHDNGRLDRGPVRSAMIVPEAQWSVAEYLQQCALDPNTLGAFIVLPPSLSNSVENYIVLMRNKTEVALSVMIAKCTHEAAGPGATAAKAPNPGENASVVWASFAERGQSGRSQVEFFPLAILTSVYLALSPQRTTQTTTTTVYPVSTPIPAGGAKQQVQTVNGSVLNAQGTSTLQQGVLTAFASTGGPGSTIGAAAAPEKQAYHAADDALEQVVIKQLNVECGGRSIDALHVFCGW